DGANWLVVEIPVGRESQQSTSKGASLREAQKGFDHGPGVSAGHRQVYRRSNGYHFESGKTYHLELAFVDRRVTLAVDGRLPFEPLDLPEVEQRADIIRPIQMGARGVNGVVSNLRLFRDVHYTRAGKNAVHGVVTLGAHEYFVLGDNSPNSDGSR